MSVLVRAGVPIWGGALFDGATLHQPGATLVSANAIWSRRAQSFEHRWNYEQSARGVALDSAGFVATKLYGGAFPWALEQYVHLGAYYPWDWWAQMDLCCEPEVAGDRATVLARVAGTADLLRDCRDHAIYLRDCEGMSWAQEPMPVLQGWLADDYRRSAALAADVLGGEWPALVGVGSVCRRGMTGPSGVPAVVGALDAVLPPHVGLHLFGVKSSGLASFAAHPRVASVDSCAWDFAARVNARRAGVANTVDLRLAELTRWRAEQELRTVAPRQMSLL